MQLDKYILITPKRTLNFIQQKCVDEIEFNKLVLTLKT